MFSLPARAMDMLWKAVMSSVMLTDATALPAFTFGLSARVRSSLITYACSNSEMKAVDWLVAHLRQLGTQQALQSIAVSGLHRCCSS